MKKIKVFYGDVRLKDIYPFATRWEVIKFKTMEVLRGCFFIAICVAFVVLVAETYAYLKPHRVYAEVPVFVEVETIPPVMKRIAQCESGNIHRVNGQVVVNVNNNGTYDTGKYQINSIWNKQATALGFDLTKEKDNEAFAMYLYKNKGTSPWVYSSKCWNK